MMSQGEHNTSTITQALEEAMLGINDNHFGSDEEQQPPCHNGNMVTSSSSDPEFIVLSTEAEASCKMTGLPKSQQSSTVTAPPEGLLEPPEPSGQSWRCASCHESGSKPEDSTEKFHIRMVEVQSEIRDLLKDIKDSFQSVVLTLHVIADALQRD